MDRPNCFGEDNMTDKIDFMKMALRKKRFLGRPVPIVPFANWDYYYTTEILEWRPEGEAQKLYEKVQVPRGFVTDLASIPAVFWTVLPPAGPYSYPAIVHDYLYWFQPCARDAADDILRFAMRDLNVSTVKVATIYEAVRLGGHLAWASNNAARAVGEKRVLKKFPDDMKITWEYWKARNDVFDDSIV
jgi:hypothetical protein